MGRKAVILGPEIWKIGTRELGPETAKLGPESFLSFLNCSDGIIFIGLLKGGEKIYRGLSTITLHLHFTLSTALVSNPFASQNSPTLTWKLVVDAIQENPRQSFYNSSSA